MMKAADRCIAHGRWMLCQLFVGFLSACEVLQSRAGLTLLLCSSEVITDDNMPCFVLVLLFRSVALRSIGKCN